MSVGWGCCLVVTVECFDILEMEAVLLLFECVCGCCMSMHVDFLFDVWHSVIGVDRMPTFEINVERMPTS